MKDVAKRRRLAAEQAQSVYADSVTRPLFGYVYTVPFPKK